MRDGNCDKCGRLDKLPPPLHLARMVVHLLKVAVGIESIEHLREVQTLRRGNADVACSYTRHMPRRADEVIEGGSIYWVIKRAVRARQRILGFEELTGGERKRCALLLDPELIPTEPAPRRPHQGWRYLEADQAPPDLARDRNVGAGMPAEMVAELRELGLI